MAIGIEHGRLGAGDRVAMLGIGSGINCLMLGVEWQRSVADLNVAAALKDRLTTQVE
jgi:hypothetical protein